MNKKDEIITTLKKMPKAITALTALNVIVFVICTFTGDLLYNKGCTSVIFLYNHEWYRLITSMFLHSGIQHIISNMLILYFMGEMIENKTSSLTIVFIYFGAGIAGNILSAVYEVTTQSYSYSVGASGAVFGLMGFLLVLVLLGRMKSNNLEPMRVILAVMMSLYMGFSSTSVNNAAHIGGLAFGLLAGIGYCIIKRDPYARI